jgi:PAS domain S-box-containing protein
MRSRRPTDEPERDLTLPDESRPAATRRILAVLRSWLPVAIGVAVTLTITCIAFLGAERAEQHRVVKGLELRAEWRSDDLREKTNDVWQTLIATAGFIAARPVFDASAFERFTTSATKRGRSIEALVWAPLVTGGQREAFEASAGFQIADEDSAQKRVRAAERDDYTPVLFQNRVGGSQIPPGFDISSNPESRIAEALARDSGSPKTVYLSKILPENPTYLAFWPIFSGGAFPATIAERRDRLRGYVVGVYRIVDVLAGNLADTPEILETIQFYVASEASDEMEPEHAEHLVATYTPTDRIIRPAAVSAPAASVAYRSTRSFAVRGQRWRMEFLFSPAAMAAEQSIGPDAILVAGLLLTALFGAYMIRGRRQMSVVQAIVDVRTAELRQTNDSLQQSKTQLEALIDASPYAIICLDAGNRVIIWNAAAESLFGYTEAEVLGHASPLLLPAEYEDFPLRLERMASGGVQRNIPSDRRHKDGAIISTNSSAAAFRDETGAVLGIIFVIEDMRERNLIQTQLRQAQKMEAIGQLTGGMAHDFNNLLSVIIGNLDMLRDVRPDDPEVIELSGEALDAAVRGADLTRRLLAFARRQPLQPQHIDLNALIANHVKLISRLLGEQIEISLDLAPGVCGALADPAQLEAALTNLATNARDAMPRGGRLTIATGNHTLDAEYAELNPGVIPGDYSMIAVTDSGTGMPPEVVSRIFEPFYTTKDRDHGTGLGLSMVFGFLKQSSGHISVYSEVGIGTTFRLFLPCAAGTEEIHAADVAPAAIAMGKGETVLTVEDNAPLRRIVTRQLRELGYSVLEAGNAEEGLAILEDGGVDLLMTDIVMPGGMDGFELARIAKERWPDLKMLLTSGFPETRLAGGLPSPHLRLLIKPYASGDLARSVRESLDT